MNSSPEPPTTQSPSTSEDTRHLSALLNQPDAPGSLQPYLQIENVHKTFGSFVALKNIYLDVYPGEFVCLLGPSGCGKTTLLRIIAGLEQQSSGRVIQGGKDVSWLPPSQRDFGIVFQSYALFPNLTATQNIGYGLENSQLPRSQVRARVEELLAVVGLEGMGHKYPAQLSGGQQQRVALARALAQSPGLLLLDEPLSALDAKVRVRLRTELTQLQKRLGVTTVMVTHDQAEALAMADRVVVMDKGYIAQVGTPHAVYQQPHSPFVADFIGVMNFLPAKVIAPQQVQCGEITLNVIQTLNQTIPEVTLAIRPEDLCLLGEVNHLDPEVLSRPNIIQAEVEALEFQGSSYLVTLNLPGEAQAQLAQLMIDVPIHDVRQLDFRRHGSRLAIQIPPELIRIFE